MVLKIDDWEFEIDMDATRDHASYAALEHCTCSYCENYYRAVRMCYPGLKASLSRFGLHIDGPVEMYPFEPTLYLVGYRVHGRILRYGAAPMMTDGIPITAVPFQHGYFIVEVGEMALPWLLQENPDDVISPANEPEFLLKMYQKMYERGFGSLIQS